MVVLIVSIEFLEFVIRNSDGISISVLLLLGFVSLLFLIFNIYLEKFLRSVVFFGDKLSDNKRMFLVSFRIL